MDRREGVEVGGKVGIVLTLIIMEGMEEGAKVVGLFVLWRSSGLIKFNVMELKHVNG